MTCDGLIVSGNGNAAMGDLMSHWLAEGEYVCETGWPNIRLTLSDDGWMGIAPSGREVLLRSLDFWRMENGKDPRELGAGRSARPLRASWY